MTQERELIRLALRILGESTKDKILFGMSQSELFGISRAAIFLHLYTPEFREIENAMRELYYGPDLLEFDQ